jgi:hypothetical protein
MRILHWHRECHTQISQHFTKDLDFRTENMVKAEHLLADKMGRHATKGIFEN